MHSQEQVLLNENNNECNEETEHQNKKHPLESELSIWNQILNKLFYFWIFKIIQKGKLTNNDVPNLPSEISANIAYKQWENIYNERKQQNLSTSTLWNIYICKKL